MWGVLFSTRLRLRCRVALTSVFLSRVKPSSWASPQLPSVRTVLGHMPLLGLGVSRAPLLAVPLGAPVRAAAYTHSSCRAAFRRCLGLGVCVLLLHAVPLVTQPATEALYSSRQ